MSTPERMAIGTLVSFVTGEVSHRVDYARADWAIEWFKDRHLAWCRCEGNETAMGFDEWIDEQWAAVFADSASRATEGRRDG